jgi:type I restriction enzyme S subunit
VRAVIKQRVEMILRGEVPEGYKQTKVGIIPQEWEVEVLSGLGTFGKGKGISSKDIVEVGLPAIMYGDIYVKFDTYFQKADQKITKETAEKSSPIKKGDLLFTTSGETAEEIGKCVCYLGNETVYIGGDIIKFSPDKTDSLYLAYLQNSFSQIKQKATHGQGFSVVHIYKSNLENLQIPCPDKDEQTTIAQILSTVDKVIETTETLITLKQQKKKWLMQNLLTGKVRLPEYDNCPVSVQERIKMINEGIVPEGYKETKVGIIPEEWEEKKLGKYCKITTGSLNANAMVPNGKYRFYTCAADFFYIDKYRFDDEALLISGNGANVGYVHYYKGKFDAYQRTYVLTSFSEVIIYTKYYLEKALKRKIDKEKNAGNTPYIRIGTISNMIVPIPNLKEQTAIANVLSTADKEIDLLNQKLDTLKQQKKALMQLLLTGIVRTTGINLSSDTEEEGVAYVQ